MKVLALLCLVVCCFGVASGQAANNSIKDRIKLEPDAAPLHSSTAQSTVEWECVNKALTNKCLVYHNDLWYYFSLDNPGPYYLNISAQQCRDKRGLQVIVIEGNPCETSTYRILQCIPKIADDEVFIPLGELKANTPYLVEIDGFLGDYCAFDIQISTRPRGMPLETTGIDTLGFRVSHAGSLVQLKWRVPADRNVSLGGFRVYKSKQPFVRFDLEREVPVERNAYGLPSQNYSIQDTIDVSGVYKYRVFGYRDDNHMPFLFGEDLVSYQEKYFISLPPVPSHKVSIPLDYDATTEYSVRIYEEGSHALLTEFKRAYRVKETPSLEVDLTEYITRGLTSFLVLVVRANEKAGKEYYFTVDKKGMLKRN